MKPNIIRKYGILPVLLALCALAQGCRKEGDIPSGNSGRMVDTGIWLKNSAPTSKSTFEGSASQINTVLVMAYRDGALEAFRQCSAGNASIRLLEGKKYNIYVLANCSGINCPEEEAGLDTLRVRLHSWEEISSTGIPMSNVTPAHYTATEGGGVMISLVRLMARYSVSVAKYSDIYGGTQQSSLKINGMTVRNAPTSATPFRTGSRAESTMDGDIARQQDLKAVECGGKSVFYIFENMNGTIPSIETQRDKDALNIEAAGCDSDLYTYLEIKGNFTYSDRPDGSSDYELDQDMCIRCWMGENGTDDFNIERNVNYSCRIVYSDFGWTLENGRVGIEKVNEDATYLIFFCNENGAEVESVEYGCEDNIKLYFKALNCNVENLSVTATSSFSSLHLETDGSILDMGGGLFCQSFINRHTERQMTQSAVFTITDSTHGISSSATCTFSGSNTGVAQWLPETDQDIYY